MSEWNENNSYVKYDVAQHEFDMHMAISKMAIVNMPRVYYYDQVGQVMYMERIGHMSVADFYGDAFAAVPDEVIESIRATIRALYQHGIIYPDITGYNFIHVHDKIWIVDFEHANFREGLPLVSGHVNFVREFIGSVNVPPVLTWNSEFR